MDISSYMKKIRERCRAALKRLDARINEKYLLEVLPNKVYNITDYIIKMD